MSIRELQQQREQERQQQQTSNRGDYSNNNELRSQDYDGNSSSSSSGLHQSGGAHGGEQGAPPGVGQDESGMPVAVEQHDGQKKKGILGTVQDKFASAESKLPHSDTPHNSLDGVGGGYGAGVAGKHDGLPFFKPKDTSTHDPVVEAREKKQHGGGIAGAVGGIGGAIGGALGGHGHRNEHESDRHHDSGRHHEHGRDSVTGASSGMAGMSLNDKDRSAHSSSSTSHHTSSTSHASTSDNNNLTTSGGFLHRNNHHERDAPSSTSHHHGAATAAGLGAASAAGAGLASHSGSRSTQDNVVDSQDKNHKYDHAPPPADPKHDQVFADTDPTTTNRRGHQEFVDPNKPSSPTATHSNRHTVGAGAGAGALGAGGIAAAAHSHHRDQQQQQHQGLDPARDPAFNPQPTSHVPHGDHPGPAQGFPSSGGAKTPPHHAVFGQDGHKSSSSTGDRHQGTGAAVGAGLGAGAGAAALASQHHGRGDREGPTSALGYESHPPSAHAPHDGTALPRSSQPAVGYGNSETGNPFSHQTQAPPTSASHHQPLPLDGGVSAQSTHNPSSHPRPSTDAHHHAGAEDKTTTHKPSLADKILGTTDVLIGKVSHNPEMVADGKARKSGVAAPSTFGDEGQFLHGAGGKGKHGAQLGGDSEHHQHHSKHGKDGEPDAYEQVMGHPRSEETRHAGQGFGGLQGGATGPMP